MMKINVTHALFKHSGSNIAIYGAVFYPELKQMEPMLINMWPKNTSGW